MNNNFENLDVLKKAEKLVEETNNKVSQKKRSLMRRYPISFSLLIVFGVVAVHDGIKGLIEEFGFTSHPVMLLVVGIIVLVFTGAIFKDFDVE
jgi:heme/copper-type cytochrome/quinol oxidase subunit 4